MNPAIRAHRILAKMTNYRPVAIDNSWVSGIRAPRLGDPIGAYTNPGADEVVGIFTNGLAWQDAGRVVNVMFDDLAEVALPEGKESLSLLIRVRDGSTVLLPVKGRRGAFYDSMEMLRFLDRVMQDRSER